FTNLIAVEVITKAGRRRAAGILVNGFGARIVKIDAYREDVIPNWHLLIIKHKDKPGAIGRVGTMMAKDNIIIATMEVGRSDMGRDAIMALTMDRPISEKEIEKLVELTEIYKAKAIDL